MKVARVVICPVTADGSADSRWGAAFLHAHAVSRRMHIVRGRAGGTELTGTLYERGEQAPSFSGAPNQDAAYVWICDEFYEVIAAARSSNSRTARSTSRSNHPCRVASTRESKPSSVPTNTSAPSSLESASIRGTSNSRWKRKPTRNRRVTRTNSRLSGSDAPELTASTVRPGRPTDGRHNCGPDSSQTVLRTIHRASASRGCECERVRPPCR